MAVGVGVKKTFVVDGFEVEVNQAMAAVEKAQQLAGHFPDEEALTRTRRVLTGEVSYKEARAEIDRKYGFA